MTHDEWIAIRDEVENQTFCHKVVILNGEWIATVLMVEGGEPHILLYPEDWHELVKPDETPDDEPTLGGIDMMGLFG